MSKVADGIKLVVDGDKVAAGAKSLLVEAQNGVLTIIKEAGTTLTDEQKATLAKLFEANKVDKVAEAATSAKVGDAEPDADDLNEDNVDEDDMTPAQIKAKKKAAEAALAAAKTVEEARSIAADQIAAADARAKARIEKATREAAAAKAQQQTVTLGQTIKTALTEMEIPEEYHDRLSDEIKLAARIEGGTMIESEVRRRIAAFDRAHIRTKDGAGLVSARESSVNRGKIDFTFT